MEEDEYTPEQLALAFKALAGEESFLSDIRDAIGLGGSKTEQVKELEDGKLAQRFMLGANTVSRLTSKALGSNEGVIQSLLSRAKSVDVHEAKVSGKLIADLTVESNPDHLLKDQKILTDTISLVMKYQSELESYGTQINTLLKAVTSAKGNEQLTEISTKLGLVKFPILKLEKRDEDGEHSDELPGGKQIHCKTNPVGFVLDGTADPKGEQTFELNKSDLTKYLTQMRWVNTQQKSLSEMINRYAKFLKNWSTTVKETQAHLDKTEGVSKSVNNQLVSFMALNSSQVEFYTTFLPRLIAYLNHYVNQGNELATVVLD
ncbi:hypothetical protein HWC35_gp086 [Vibrio phage USC-1]|uniref:Uncharacterized protein n=2 Tax=Aphroditevirus USC1 TaxID=2846605 RepID=A0A514A2G8_9CAUD|nr:hypothetical protein HWC35_gp086 [Vibrio phage USC-1]QCW23248.1 hypothetical protein [Vibrio phage 5 TSL-2019]QDH47480.1 hypothetical protein [Vibrio phage USC-1]